MWSVPTRFVASVWLRVFDGFVQFYSTHNTGSDGSFQPYPYPKELFLKFIKENDGYFPGQWVLAACLF